MSRTGYPHGVVIIQKKSLEENSDAKFRPTAAKKIET